MQFIENSSFGVRSSILSLACKSVPLKFILFPMMHIGEPSYYGQIAETLSTCDVIVYEGVQSKTSKIITSSYRQFAQNRDCGLTTQNEALDMESLGAELIHADMSGNEFDREWSNLPFAMRLSVILFTPLLGIVLKLFGDKILLSVSGDVNDLPDRSAVLNPDDPFSGLIIKKRDKELLKRLDNVFREKRSKNQTIGIVYGAKHMPAVAGYLINNLGYYVQDARWVNIATF